MSAIGTRMIQKEFSIISVLVMPNGMLQVMFNNGDTNYFHPDALIDLADDFGDKEGVVLPIDDNPDNNPADNDNDNDDETDLNDKDEEEDLEDGT